MRRRSEKKSPEKPCGLKDRDVVKKNPEQAMFGVLLNIIEIIQIPFYFHAPKCRFPVF